MADVTCADCHMPFISISLNIRLLPDLCPVAWYKHSKLIGQKMPFDRVKLLLFWSYYTSSVRQGRWMLHQDVLSTTLIVSLFASIFIPGSSTIPISNILIPLSFSPFVFHLKCLKTFAVLRLSHVHRTVFPEQIPVKSGSLLWINYIWGEMAWKREIVFIWHHCVFWYFYC